MTKVTLHAENISCQHCAMTIKRVLGNVQGVKVIGVDIAGKDVTLEVANDGALRRAKDMLREIGYPVAA